VCHPAVGERRLRLIDGLGVLFVAVVLSGNEVAAASQMGYLDFVDLLLEEEVGPVRGAGSAAP
jgi:hypothetical protein